MKIVNGIRVPENTDEVNLEVDLEHMAEDVGDVAADAGATAGAAAATQVALAPVDTQMATVAQDTTSEFYAVQTATVGSAITTELLGQQLRSLYADDFDGTALDPAWTVVNPNPSAMRVQDGALELDFIPTTYPDGTTDTAQNLVMVPVPDGQWVAECEMSAPVTANGQRAGLMAFRTQRDYAFLQYQGVGSAYRRSFMYERGNSTRNVSNVDFTAPAIGSLPDTVRFRLVCDGDRIVAYDSTDDGATWTAVGRPAPADLFNYVGLWAGNVSTTPGTARFHSFTLQGAPVAPVVPPANEAAPFTMNAQANVALPSDTLSVTLRDILRNSDKYTLNTWIPATYGAQGAADYYNLGTFTGTMSDEPLVRAPAMAAFGLAVSTWTRAYDQTAVGGVTIANARAAAIKLALSVAKSNIANQPHGGWGESAAAPNGSQASHWAWFAGQAAWMLWEYLTDEQRTYVRRMVISEANRETRMLPQFWKNPAGVEYSDRVGDSASEESAWRSNLLALAACMMPTHAHRRRWERRAVELMSTAYARVEDCTSDTVLNGRTLADYTNSPLPGAPTSNVNFLRNIVGFNLQSDGTVVNHGVVHPDYMGAVQINLQNTTIYALAGEQAPKACTWNASLIYSAMTDLTFNTVDGWNAPGGTIYTPASDAIYYPQGSGWGLDRRVNFACLDAMIDSLRLDDGAGTTANAWGQLHANAALAMQARDTTGQTYQPGDDDDYALREQWVAWLAALGYLTRVLVNGQMIRLTNAPI